MDGTGISCLQEVRRETMSSDSLQRFVHYLLLSKSMPTKKEIVKKLSEIGIKKKLMKEFLQYLTETKPIYYYPYVCKLGFSLLLIEYKSLHERSIIENRYQINPFLIFRPALNTPYIYSVYSVPTIKIDDLFKNIISNNINAYLQTGYNECLSNDFKKNDLMRFAQMLVMNPFLSIRKISIELGLSYSTGKFFYNELVKKKFFEGRFILSKNNHNYLRQYLFLVRKGYEEPSIESDSLYIDYMANFSYKSDVVKLGMALVFGTEMFLTRAAGLLGKYDLLMSNIFSHKNCP